MAAEIAHDEHASIEAARDFWQRVSRPNVMIKIPGTPEGAGAIEKAIYEGININVTLLFAVEAYERVAEAYLKGLERRLAEDKPLDVALGGELLRLPGRHRRRQAAGGSSAARTCTARRRSPTHAWPTASFERIFSGPRWDALRHAGAHLQRPLWASTGVKNQRYPDTMYVDELVGPHTVNTMPLADPDGGRRPRPHPRPDRPARSPRPTWTRSPTPESISARSPTSCWSTASSLFEDAMNRLLTGIEERRQAVVTGKPPTIEARLPSELAQPVAERVARATAEDVAQRIWRKDPSLWGGTAETPEISDRLGWLTVSETMLEHAPALNEFVAGMPRRRLHRRGAARAWAARRSAPR